MQTSFVRSGSNWCSVDQVFVRDNGSWCEATEVYVKHNGSWCLVHSIEDSGGATVGTSSGGDPVWEFSGSDTFTLSSPKSTRFVVCAGGGNSSNDGGGGGGGVSVGDSFTLPAGTYTVTVGGANGNSSLVHSDGTTVNITANRGNSAGCGGFGCGGASSGSGFNFITNSSLGGRGGGGGSHSTHLSLIHI